MKKVLFFSLFLTQAFCMETTLLLIRHGETTWNKEQRMQGHTDMPLNEQGLMQAKRLAEMMRENHADIDLIYSSDLMRAYATAQETAKQLDLEIKTSALLREKNWGEAEGLFVVEKEALYAEGEEALKKTYPNHSERWKFSSIPGAETDYEVFKRMHEELSAIAKEHSGKKIAIFSHGRSIRMMMVKVLGTEEILGLPNCAVVHFSYVPENTEQPFQFVKVENMKSN